MDTYPFFFDNMQELSALPRIIEKDKNSKIPIQYLNVETERIIKGIYERIV